MRTFHSRVVRWARKPRTCTWCGDPIETGRPYQSYRWADGGDAGTVVLHPECSDAMDAVGKTDPHFVGWCPGDFLRGSTKVR
jgi:hypothetical protein